jgi:hypothetical protein
MANPCTICGSERANSPSDFFCSDQCQRDWHARRSEPLAADAGTWLPTHMVRASASWRAA